MDADTAKRLFDKWCKKLRIVIRQVQGNEVL